MFVFKSTYNDLKDRYDNLNVSINGMKEQLLLKNEQIDSLSTKNVELESRLASLQATYDNALENGEKSQRGFNDNLANLRETLSERITKIETMEASYTALEQKYKELQDTYTAELAKASERDIAAGKAATAAAAKATSERSKVAKNVVKSAKAPKATTLKKPKPAPSASAPKGFKPDTSY